jgi:hypothetical protein
VLRKKSVPQPLKRQYGQSTFGTAEAAPLSNSDFPATWEAVALNKTFSTDWLTGWRVDAASRGVSFFHGCKTGL